MENQNESLRKDALRYNEGKVQWSLVSFKDIEEIPRVLEFGAKKYSRDNWKKGMPVTEMCDSLLRHVIAFASGEDIDPESGLSHLGHIGCNIMFINHTLKNHPEKDDRNSS